MTVNSKFGTFSKEMYKFSTISIKIWDKDDYFNGRSDEILAVDTSINQLLQNGCFESDNGQNKVCVMAFWKDELII